VILSLNIKIKRSNAVKDLVLEVRPKRVTSIVTLSYLEPLGMYFDSHLVLRRVDADSKAQTQGLEAGDKLLQIGATPLKTPADLRSLLPTLERGIIHHMLFERNKFQFFVTLELPK